MESESSTGIIIAVIIATAALIGGGLLLANQSDDSEQQTETVQQMNESQDAMERQRQTIVDAAAANENLSTLVTAVQAADLAETLSGEEKFTVFAPTNAAFNKLPAGTLDNLLQPENKATLASILTYHVVSGEVLSSELSDGQTITTVNGAQLTVAIQGDSVFLVDATGARSQVTQADIRVDNGVIHAIDTVVMPQ